MKHVFWLIVAVAIALPWLFIELWGHGHNLAKSNPGLVSLISGVAIIGAAFILSWGAELSERDIPRSLALIALALISVLPEYAVDLHFAWAAGKDPSQKAYAIANMTGANRVLIGVGWPLVVIVYYFRYRRKEVLLDNSQSLELGLLLMATIYSLIIPLKGAVSLIDCVVFFAMFLYYAGRAARSERHEEALEGIAGYFDERLGNRARRLVILLMFAFAGYIIWIAAEPFAKGLVATGKASGVDEFLLVQWLAPLASESPECVIALLFALKGRGSIGIGALISSKVNQWTLLVGAIPLVYAISADTFGAMDLDHRQKEEILLTSAQSLFAALVIADFRLSLREAVVLIGLFIAQLLLPQESIRYVFSGTYFAAALWMIVSSPTRRQLVRNALLFKKIDISKGVVVGSR